MRFDAARGKKISHRKSLMIKINIKKKEIQNLKKNGKNGKNKTNMLLIFFNYEEVSRVIPAWRATVRKRGYD